MAKILNFLLKHKITKQKHKQSLIKALDRFYLAKKEILDFIEIKVKRLRINKDQKLRDLKFTAYFNPID